MADIAKLRAFVEAAGVAVRAGLLTPSMDDEIYIRKYFELPEMNADVKAEWERSNGTRGPITIAKEEAQATADAASESGNNDSKGAQDGN